MSQYKNFHKTAMDTLMFSKASIAYIEKPARCCGSSTVIMNYIANRLEYEEDFNIGLVMPSPGVVDYQWMILNPILIKNETIFTRNKSFMVTGNNNKLFTYIFKPEMEDYFRGLSLDQLIITDHQETPGDPYLFSGLSHYIKPDGNIIVEICENVRRCEH